MSASPAHVELSNASTASSNSQYAPSEAMSSPARMQQERSVVLVLVSLHAVAVAALIIKFSRSLQSASAAAERRAARRCPGPDVVCVYQPLVRRTSCGDERSVATRCCGSPRARRAPNWTSFCGSARTPPKRCCARARVLIAATRRGDGVASALARGHGSGGGSESATASARTFVEEALLRGLVCRARRPAARAQQLGRPRAAAAASTTSRCSQ